MPALMTAAMLALTLGLGVWQVQRLAWKQNLLAEIDRGEATLPVPLSANPEPFRRVVATGRFLPAVARYGTALRSVPGSGTVIGSDVVAPLQRLGAPTVLVDRGWAPSDTIVALPDGEVQVIGYVRPADHANWTSVSDSPATRTFYTLDPAVIGPALGVPDLAPFTLIALGDPATPGRYPEPATALPRPPNDHLTYAITWFGLSAALLAVFLVYARQVLVGRRAPA